MTQAVVPEVARGVSTLTYFGPRQGGGSRVIVTLGLDTRDQTAWMRVLEGAGPETWRGRFAHTWDPVPCFSLTDSKNETADAVTTTNANNKEEGHVQWTGSGLNIEAWFNRV
jgi:hypothetical protein